MNDIEIKNATILDGLGNEPYTGNIYVKNGKIVVITHKETYDARVSLDASGKIVSPGFIDLHTHSDISFLLDSTAQSKVRQGVTLELIGNCGLSICAPLIGDARNMLPGQTCITYESVGSHAVSGNACTNNGFNTWLLIVSKLPNDEFYFNCAGKIW